MQQNKSEQMRKLLDDAADLVETGNVPQEVDDLFTESFRIDDTYTTVVAAYQLGMKTAGVMVVENEMTDEEMTKYVDDFMNEQEAKL